MAFDIQNFAVDAKKEADGVWVEYAMGLQLLIGRKRSAKWRAALREVLKPYRNVMRIQDLDDEAALEVNIQLMSKVILLGWRNMEEGGVPVEYSEKEAYRILKKYPKFLDDVDSMSDDFTLFKAKADADDLGNSERP